ncbi:hypothetical protein QN277_008046 [Acacia crassicarpa]|uniref:Myb-like domain-containing protein n=1 Tax=Acacia crassicarpa TaxID=499986 RepID=A0AAE1M6U1_9FABA|nr:hypothetical protein QN277_008046 [Acacia crassicarpa]
MVEQEMRKGPWTEQEDIKLMSFVGFFGDRRWDFIAKISGLKVAGDRSQKVIGKKRLLGLAGSWKKDKAAFNHFILL